MLNEEKLSAELQSNVELRAELTKGVTFNAKAQMGSPPIKNALLYVAQELTEEQLNQVRQNLSLVGKKVPTGKTFAPYVVDEANDYAYIYDDPVEAQEGAEILNDYSNNIATGLTSQASGYQTQAIGNYSKAGGWWTRADGQCAVAEGLLSRSSGHFSHAEGTRTQATINNAHSEGDRTTASGRQSHSEGVSTIASGYCAHAEGSTTEATNYYSHAEGFGTISAGRNQTAMGKYNIKDTTSLLIVGKGSGKSNRSNAFTVSSAGNGWFAGTVTSTGADYAEYFEWLDGNPNNEDRVGLIVTLEGDKIKIANDGDDFIGIVSGTAMVLGDNHEWEWKDKYVTDDYGRIVYDEPVEEFIERTEYVDPANPKTWKTVKESIGFSTYPKMNPNYDPTKEYINRADRQEWDAIGMLGKLHVNDDGSCVVGGYAKVGKDGIATASTEKTNMRVMKRITDNIVQVLLK